MEFLNNVHRINGQPITEIERNQIIMMLGRGMELRDIALTLDYKTVKKWVERFGQTGNIKV
jgi:transposase